MDNLSCEPMDIDLSSNSIKEMDISYNDSVDISLIKSEKIDSPTEDIHQTIRLIERRDVPSTVKTYRINIQKPTKSYRNTVFQILFAGIIIFISLLIAHFYSLKCCDDLNLEDLRHTLSSKLFGQTEAINMIIKTLENLGKTKLLLFSGGTGVGKTLASSIILDTLGPCSNVYHYTMPSFTSIFSTDFMYGLAMCKMSLMIVDDLTVNDMHIKAQIKEVTEKSEFLRKDITVILIYNCYESTKEFVKKCDDAFRNKLLENFAEIKAIKQVVEFKPLKESDLIGCIKQELGNRSIENKEFEDILKNFNVTIDGCKGVHSKMKYLNIV